MYLRGMEVVEAQETLRLSQISAYPHLKKGDRLKFYGDVRKLVRIESPAQEPVSMEEFARRVGEMVYG